MKLLRTDPTRTITIRRAFVRRLRKKFAALKGKVASLLVREDALGATLNCNPGQLRGADGKCGPGIGVGVPRDEMPQIKSSDVPDFLQWAVLQGVGIVSGWALASELSPTQSHFRQERVDSLPEEALALPILVSEDDYVLDGTHRWVKHWQTDKDSIVPVLRVRLSLEESLRLMREYPRVLYVENAFCPTGQGGGVDPTCSPSLMHGTSYSSGKKILDEGIRPGRDGFVYATPSKDTAVEYGWSQAVKEAERTGKEKSDAKFAVVTIRSGAGFSVDNPSPSGDRWQWTKNGHVPPKDISKVEVYSAWHPYSSAPIEVLTRNDETGELYVVVPLDSNVFNTRWAFQTDAQQYASFVEWLKKEIGDISGADEERYWEEYVKRGFLKGMGRAFDDVQRKRGPAPDTPEKMDFFRGTREQFLRSAFGQPEAVDKVKLLVSRSFDELEGLSAQSAKVIQRALADGLVEGKHPKEIAKVINDEIDLAEGRAEMIAQTELIRAHAEGQLLAFEELGVQQLGVQVEFATAGDDAVCEECDALDGTVMDIDDAHGIIPVHPNCRCCFVPYIDVVENKFCPTGPGGGIDPTCGGGGTKRYPKSPPKSVLNPLSKETPAYPERSTALSAKDLPPGDRPKWLKVKDAYDKTMLHINLVAEKLAGKLSEPEHMEMITTAAEEAQKQAVYGAPADWVEEHLDLSSGAVVKVTSAAMAHILSKVALKIKKVSKDIVLHPPEHVHAPTLLHPVGPIVVHAAGPTAEDVLDLLTVLNSSMGWGSLVLPTKEAVQEILDRLMSYNAFCATGPGGGVDPTCGTHSSSGMRVAHFVASMPSHVLKYVRGKAAEKYAKLERRYGKAYAAAVIGAAVAGFAVPFPGASLAVSAPVVALAEMHRFVKGLHAHNSLVLDAAVEELIEDLKREFADLDDGVINVFCPTGPGGGVDPTCSVTQRAAEATKKWITPLKFAAKVDEAIKAAAEGRHSDAAKLHADVAKAHDDASYNYPARSMLRAKHREAAELHRSAESVHSAFNAFNAFCPTGKGGGIDPHCAPANKGAGVVNAKDLAEKLGKQFPRVFTKLQLRKIEKANPFWAPGKRLLLDNAIVGPRMDAIKQLVPDVKAIHQQVVLKKEQMQTAGERTRAQMRRKLDGEERPAAPRRDARQQAREALRHIFGEVRREAKDIPQHAAVLIIPHDPELVKMASTPITEEKRLGGGINSSYKVILSDGMKGVWKPSVGEAEISPQYGVTHGTSYLREAASYAVAKEVGLKDLQAPCVVREINGKIGALRQWVDGSPAMGILGDRKFDGDKDLARAAAFDALTGAGDRHPGNWLIGKSGTNPDKIALIDEGLTFPKMMNTGFHSQLRDAAAARNLKVPEEVKNWDGEKIKGILKEHKLEDKAIELTMTRLNALKAVAARGGTFKDRELSNWNLGVPMGERLW